MAEEYTWTVANGELEGHPLILRVRNQPPAFAHKVDFPYLLELAWKTEEADENGMPGDTEQERMSQLEDLLEEALEGAEQAFLTTIATGKGLRQWHWYVRDPESTMALVNQTLGELEPFPIEFSFHQDPEWGEYQSVLESL